MHAPPRLESDRAVNPAEEEHDYRASSPRNFGLLERRKDSEAANPDFSDKKKVRYLREREIVDGRLRA